MTENNTLDLTNGSTLIAPDSPVFETDGGCYEIIDYSIYSGYYTLKPVGLPRHRETLHRRERTLKKNWEME